jgi:hypothetical protein
MKKAIKLFILIALAGWTGTVFQSCNKIKIGQDVTWDGNDVTITVPAVNDVQQHNEFGTGTFTYNIDSFIKAKTINKFGLSDISKLTLNKCQLTIINPDSANNFANFEQCNAVFSTTQNLVLAQIANITNNPDTYAGTLDIPVDKTIDLKSYFGTGTNTIDYAVGGKLRRPTTKELTIKVHIGYNIHVGN